MKTRSASDWCVRAARVLVPCAVGIAVTGCGGSDSPPERAAPASVVEAVQAPAAVPSSATVAAPVDPVHAQTGVDASAAGVALASAQRASSGNVVVASVLPRPRVALATQAPGPIGADTPARWLDAELPQGTVSQPVVVVVPGALPHEAASLALQRASASRLAR